MYAGLITQLNLLLPNLKENSESISSHSVGFFSKTDTGNDTSSLSSRPLGAFYYKKSSSVSPQPQLVLDWPKHWGSNASGFMFKLQELLRDSFLPKGEFILTHDDFKFSLCMTALPVSHPNILLDKVMIESAAMSLARIINEARLITEKQLSGCTEETITSVRALEKIVPKARYQHTALSYTNSSSADIFGLVTMTCSTIMNANLILGTIQKFLKELDADCTSISENKEDASASLTISITVGLREHLLNTAWSEKVNELHAILNIKAREFERIKAELFSSTALLPPTTPLKFVLKGSDAL